MLPLLVGVHHTDPRVDALDTLLGERRKAGGASISSVVVRPFRRDASWNESGGCDEDARGEFDSDAPGSLRKRCGRPAAEAGPQGGDGGDGAETVLRPAGARGEGGTRNAGAEAAVLPDGRVHL